MTPDSLEIEVVLQREVALGRLASDLNLAILVGDAHTAATDLRHRSLHRCLRRDWLVDALFDLQCPRSSAPLSLYLGRSRGKQDACYLAPTREPKIPSPWKHRLLSGILGSALSQKPRDRCALPSSCHQAWAAPPSVRAVTRQPPTVRPETNEQGRPPGAAGTH